MQQKKTQMVSFQRIAKLFAEKPPIINLNLKGSSKLQKMLFTDRRLELLHKEGFMLIKYVDIPNSKLLNHFTQKKIAKKHLELLNSISESNLNLLGSERPRSEICFIKMTNVPDTEGENYYEQTRKIFSYLKALFPEVSKNKFFRDASQEISAKYSQVYELFNKGDLSKANSILSNMIVNKTLRPNLPEVLQSTLESAIELDKYPFKDNYIMTSSITECKSFIEFGITRNNTLGIYKVKESSSNYSTSGTSMIFGIDFLSKLL